MHPPPTVDNFIHEEPGRRIVFGPGAAEVALEATRGDHILLTTRRALAAMPTAAENAAQVVPVAAGRVDEVAGELLPKLGADATEVIVSLGGGRVVDVAKALAGAGVAKAVIAIPTTLSAAEMTGFHRPAAGAPAGARMVRPAVVGNDPALSASQPRTDLAASTANSLAHALAGVTAPRATPISRAVGRDAVEQLAAGWRGGEPVRSELALGALLAGWAVDVSGLSIHHALSQTVVREAGIAHAHGNVALLPVSVMRLASTDEAVIAWVEQTLDEALVDLAVRLRDAAGGGLGARGVERGDLARLAAVAAARPDIDYLAPGIDVAQIEVCYEQAF